MVIGAYLDRMAPDHPAGAEWTILDAFTWLAKKGHDCRVVSRSDYSQERTEAGVLLYGRPTEEIVARHFIECDVMLTQLDATMDAQLLAASYQTPLVQYVHSASQIDSLGVMPSCSALVVFNSQHVADARSDWPGPSLVMRPPIDADRVRVEPGACTTLLNLSPQKGGAVLWSLAREMETTPFLGVMGAYGEQVITPKGLALGPFEKAETGLPPNLSVIAPQRDVREALRYTRQLLVLSTSETYGRVAAEAALSGIPTIAVDTPGLRDCLGDDATWIDREDYSSIRKAIRGGYEGDAWEFRSLDALRRWTGVLWPRQEVELRRFEAALEEIVANEPEMTL